MLAGCDFALAGLNADAAIGSIFVRADWRASTVRDADGILSSIASITIKGQAFGSVVCGDHFGIVAEQIGRTKISKAKLKFDKGGRDAEDAFAAAPTGDFFLREIIV